MKNLFDSLVRTYVPWLVGVLIGWLVSLGVPLDPEVETALTVVFMTSAGALYYLIVRLVEIHVSPRLGVLLGRAKQPVYEEYKGE